jgi:hypothetical protein
VEAFFATGIETIFDTAIVVEVVVVGVQADRISVPKINIKRGTMLLPREPAMQGRLISLFLSI